VTQQQRIVLASRPNGVPSQDNFRLEQMDLPEPAEGQVLLRTIWISVDPYMRGRMNDGKSYVQPLAIGGLMEGGAVSEVMHSNNPKFAAGDIVQAGTG
jgi:NADPH-dependent curcumin reductase